MEAPRAPGAERGSGKYSSQKSRARSHQGGGETVGPESCNLQRRGLLVPAPNPQAKLRPPGAARTTSLSKVFPKILWRFWEGDRQASSMVGLDFLWYPCLSGPKQLGNEKPKTDL